MTRKAKKTTVKAKVKRPALRLRDGMRLMRGDGTKAPRILQRTVSGEWRVVDARGGLQWAPVPSAAIHALLRQRFYVLDKRRPGARS